MRKMEDTGITSSEESPISTESALVDDSWAISIMLTHLPQSADVAAEAVLKSPGKSAWMYEVSTSRLFIFSCDGGRLRCDTYAKVPDDRAARDLGDAHEESHRIGIFGEQYRQHMVDAYMRITGNRYPSIQ
jgi:hypothetical protein